MIKRPLVFSKFAAWLILVIFFLTVSTILYLFAMKAPAAQSKEVQVEQTRYIWTAPDKSTIPENDEGDLIKYGEELIRHTSVYLGPKGKIKPISNGMNCSNCHLDGGTKMYGINYSAANANYPRYRHRSGTTVDVRERVNECIERSLNGTRLSPDDKELNAMTAYILWVGRHVPKHLKPEGSGLKKIEFLDRPADPEKGKLVYQINCVQCHGAAGEGVLLPEANEYQYPPLVGDHSYNNGAGLFRLSNFASFVKYNMPFGVNYQNPILTDEEAWDVAAYINSMPRPEKDISNDWPDISKKPFDHPFGPYADGYSESDHKYGPFKKMIEASN